MQQESGEPMVGAAGWFLSEIQYVRTRHEKRLPPLHKRKAFLRARVQAVMDASGGGDISRFFDAETSSDDEDAPCVGRGGTDARRRRAARAVPKSNALNIVVH